MFGGLTLLGWLQKLVKEQRQWVAECGGDLKGYSRRYGHRRAGEIYAADMEALRRHESRLAEHLGKYGHYRRGHQ